MIDLTADSEGRLDRDCGGRLNCALIAGHPGCCWNSHAEQWAGLTKRRCLAKSRTEVLCMRAHGHRGEHEDGGGITWRKRLSASSGG